jgi:hypothetical protein
MKDKLLGMALALLAWAALPAQDWETVRLEDFEGIGALSEIPDFAASSGFLLWGNGASGAAEDKAARVLQFIHGRYLALYTELSHQYEYRLRINAKTTMLNIGIGFFYEQSGLYPSATPIGNPQPMPYVASVTTPGSEVVSETFSGLEGGYWLFAGAPPLQFSGVSNNVFDNFALERRLLEGQPCPGFAGEDREICAGDDTELGCPPADSQGTDTLCYRWEPEEGLSAPHEAQPWASPSETTVYRVYVTDFHGNLIGSDEVEVVVAGMQQIMVSPDTAYICAGQQAALSAPGGFSAYEWQDGSTDPSIIVEVPGVYSVTVIDGQGCIGAGEAVVLLAEEGLGITPNPAVLCEESLTLEASGDFAWYRWTDSEGEAIGYGPTIEVEDTGYYYVHAEADNGCSLTDSIFVQPASDDLSIAASSAVLCQDGELTLSASPGFAAYKWYDAAGRLLSSSASLTVDATGEYAVLVYTSSGCQQWASLEVEESLTIDADILPSAPEICYMGDPALVPPVDGRSFANGCQAGVNLRLNHVFNSYQWSSGAASPEIWATEPGLYRVTVTDGSGCAYDAEVEVKPCLAAGFSLSPYPIHLCPDGAPVSVDAGPGFTAYAWSTGHTGPILEISSPGDYGITVTDENGCMGSKEFTVAQLDADVLADLEIYRPAALAGNTTTLVTDEDGVGAVGFVNVDDDDMDGYYDLEDKNGVKGGDDDLLRLKLKLRPGNSGINTVVLSVVQGQSHISLWRSAEKKKREAYTPGTLIELTNAEGDFLTAELWVEGVAPHTIQKGTVLRMVCSANPACPVDDEVSLTIVGMEGMEWVGIGNGFASAANTSSNVLDANDPNFGSHTYSDGSTPLLSQRVFPGGRIIGNSVSALKDTAMLRIRLSVVPPEPVTLYIRSFDVDDPSSRNWPVDPNDKRSSGIYPGTQVYGPGNELTFDRHEDNRGAVNGKKAGHFLDDADGDGIISITFDGALQAEKLFRTSTFAGDNYRAAAAFGLDMLKTLVNEDRKRHGLKIVHPMAKGGKEIPFSHQFTSPVLTVWRLLHIEFDSMENVNDDDNKLTGLFTGFEGTRVTQARAIKGTSVTLKDTPADNLNPASLDLEYGSSWKGRFEDGRLYVGRQWGNEIKIRGNRGHEAVFSQASTLLPVPFSIYLPSGDSISGEVTEIIRPNPNSDYVYELAVQQGSLSAAAAGYLLRAGLGQPVPLSWVNAAAGQAASPSLSILFDLWDDDAQAADHLLPYDFVADPEGLKADLAAFHGAYVEPVSLDVFYDSTIPFLSKIFLGSDWSFYSMGIYAQSKDIEGSFQNGTFENRKRIWIAYVASIFQSGHWRKDCDPNNERNDDPQNTDFNGVNVGLTASAGIGGSSNEIIVTGSDASVIPFENLRDVGSNSKRARSLAHEIGHQFGLGHYPSIAESDKNSQRGINEDDKNLMYFSLDPSGNASKFHAIHINLIRSREKSPGR